MTDSSGLSRRRFLQATGGAATAAALAGCLGIGGDGDGDGNGNDSDGNGTGNGTGDGGEDMEPQQGGTYRKLNSTISTFDPVNAGDTASGQIVQQVFDGLTNYPNGETQPTNLLAESVERSEDDTTYTFTLKDATFHNGNQVTAQDFVYSFERLARSPYTVRAYFILDSLGVTHETDEDGNYVPDSMGVEAQDESTLVINLDEPFHSTLAMLAYSSFAAVPSDAIGLDIDAEQTGSGEEVEPAPEYTEFSENNPIGAGPFVFENWEKGTSADVTRYDDYHGQTAYVDAVHWQVIEDDTAAFNYAMSKNVDTFGVPTPRYSQNKIQNASKDDAGRTEGQYGPFDANGETVDYLKVPEVSTFYFAFNTQNVPKPVRQAVAYITDQESLASSVFKSRQEPAYHLTPPLIYPGEGSAYDSHVEEAYPYGTSSDIEGAQQVMEEAGYGENNRFTMQFTHYVSQTWSEIAQILRQRLSGAYIDMNIEQAEFATLLERGQNGNLEAYTLGWIADWPAADNFLQLINPPNTYTGEPGVLTYTNWGRDEETEASQAAAEAWQTIQDNPGPSEEALNARNEAYIQMEEANWEDVVLVNAFHGATERFKYPYLHAPKFGAMGNSRQMYNTFWKEQEGRRTVTGTPPGNSSGNGSGQ
ncbi:ABC transporter substrate-binding protein [Halomarina oriensis]|uniref:ABC transporter substrate-binding protein n=1 Tax=Halomarina oriensis TaxID=671145 RepID=A0A6B0GIQ2_9EURY|nr:ABC transporter substrate-binding protein [Halomarina oriensis]MWG34752.1 ABC transporter substrate-binding protein [Halomarina oriensis]